MTTYSRRERLALCDLLDALGPDAPTINEGWVTRDLAAHLFVRERRPLSAFGIFLPPLAPLARRGAAQALERYGYAGVVDLLRQGAPIPMPHHFFDEAMNQVEFFVHHEDVRRAQPGWSPRTLDPAEEDELWARLRGAVKVKAAKVPAGVVLRRAGTSDQIAGATNGETRTLAGPPSELVLYALGRQRVARLEQVSEPDAPPRPARP